MKVVYWICCTQVIVALPMTTMTSCVYVEDSHIRAMLLMWQMREVGKE